MKYLNNYIDENITKLLKQYGAFFAFSDKQFLEAKDKNKLNTDYTDLGSGLVCLKENAKKLIDEMDNCIKKGIKQDIAENGEDAIIKRELYNYEAFYTGDITSTKEALKDYNFTDNNIKNIFLQLAKQQ